MTAPAWWYSGLVLRLGPVALIFDPRDTWGLGIHASRMRLVNGDRWLFRLEVLCFMLTVSRRR